MINSSKHLFLSGFLILTCACTSTPKEVSETLPSSAIPTPTQKGVENVDYEALKNSLGLSRAAESLGLVEKSFNTCQVGFGYSGTRNCRRLYFTVIHIHLLCRDSEGTVSTGIDRADQMPIAGRSVTWTLQGNRGTSQTNSDGFAQIQSVSSKSQRAQRIKLSVGNDFLYMRANEITKVVTPKSWCD